MDSIKFLQQYFHISIEDEDILLTKKADFPEDCTDLFKFLQEIKRHRENTLSRLRDSPKPYKQVVTIDIETNDLDPLKGEIKLISVFGEGIELVTSNIREVEHLLTDEAILKVVHNAGFDITWLRTKGFEVCSYMDTMVMSQIFHNHVKTDNSLRGMVSKYLKVELDKSLQDSVNWQGDITEEHKNYALSDARVTWELYHFLSEELRGLHLDCVLRREMAAIDAIIELNMTGIRFDYNDWEKELQKMIEESEQLQENVRGLLEAPNLNLQAPAQIIAALRNKGIEIEGTSDEVLAKYEEDFEVIKPIRRYKKLKKQVNAYGEKLKQAISEDGRLRGNWRLIGTDTSRMTCKQPNLQGMPGKAKPYFRSAEGHTFIVADYSNIELRILAEITKDPELTKAFQHNEDLHEKTARVVLDKQLGEVVTSEERKIGKVVNFGLVYGMTKWGLQKKIQAATGLPISLKEAETFRNRYFELYRGVLFYQDRMLKSSFIQTLGGRYWSDDHHMLPKGAIARFNYPIQATGTEGLKEALALLLQDRKRGWKLVAAVHDEIVLEVPDSDTEEASLFLKKVMVAGMSKLVKQIPIEVEINCGKYWCK
ncbi:DNA polymerase [Bacillus sp. B1-b2]|uniref:DNA polymerase n=1 Tax=Bacillus sp. B1-b2 TaxID=2653201 RepID=UPI00186AAEA0|nr:DNA polymerase [Bacillus sp. B1-b2]